MNPSRALCTDFCSFTCSTCSTTLNIRIGNRLRWHRPDESACSAPVPLVPSDPPRIRPPTGRDRPRNRKGWGPPHSRRVVYRWFDLTATAWRRRSGCARRFGVAGCGQSDQTDGAGQAGSGRVGGGEANALTSWSGRKWAATYPASGPHLAIASARASGARCGRARASATSR